MELEKTSYVSFWVFGRFSGAFAVIVFQGVFLRESQQTFFNYNVGNMFFLMEQWKASKWNCLNICGDVNWPIHLKCKKGNDSHFPASLF